MATEIDTKCPFIVPKAAVPVLTAAEESAIYKAIQIGWRRHITEDMADFDLGAKLPKFKCGLVRKHWGIVQAAGITPARKEELLEHTHIVKRVDDRLQDDGDEFNNKVGQLMCHWDPPTSWQDLIAKASPNPDFDGAFAMKMLAAAQTGRPKPSWTEFDAKYAETRTTKPLPKLVGPKVNPDAPVRP